MTKSEAGSSARLRILVAEDEAIIRLDLVEMLTDAGYQVVAEATNGVEAIALAKEHLPDIAILDVKMPELDGISAAEQIIEISPVLMLTAFSQRELVERASPLVLGSWKVLIFKDLPELIGSYFPTFGIGLGLNNLRKFNLQSAW